MLGRKDNVINSINDNHRNPEYLSTFELPSNLRATKDPAEALTGAEFVLHCIPLQASEEFLLVVNEYFCPSERSL